MPEIVTICPKHWAKISARNLKGAAMSEYVSIRILDDDGDWFDKFGEGELFTRKGRAFTHINTGTSFSMKQEDIKDYFKKVGQK